VLTIVQHQQQVPLLELIDQRGQEWAMRLLPQAQRLRYRLPHQGRVGQRGQIYQPHALRVRAYQLLGHGQRQARLAHATGAGQRHQPGSIQ
jgi:hypothetical protein